MVKFFLRLPLASTHVDPDGHSYALTSCELHMNVMKRFTIREGERQRKLRVSHEVGGMAFVYLGMAGDAIAYTDDLPAGVTAVTDD